MESQESSVHPGALSPDERVSAGGPGLYFLTLATERRQPWLAVTRTREVFLAVLRRWHMERDGRLLAVMAMPDHAHVLLELGRSVTAMQLVTRWKVAMRRAAGYAETFERDCRGHRLRETEKPEDYGLYMFLHPYRARFAQPEETWPGWWTPDPAVFQFTAALDKEGCPPAEWIVWPDEKFAHLDHGE